MKNIWILNQVQIKFKMLISLLIKLLNNKERAVANAPAMVAANTNIKFPVDLKLQLSRHTSNLIIT